MYRKMWKSGLTEIIPLIRSDQISRSVVSDSLPRHESQHARPPCPSPTPGVHWDYLSRACILLFSIPNPLRMHHWGEAAVANNSGWQLDCVHPDFSQGLAAGQLQGLMTWWPQHSLFTDMAGNSFHPQRIPDVKQEGNEELVFNGYRVFVWVMKSSANGKWWWLYNIVNVMSLYRTVQKG